MPQVSIAVSHTTEPKPSNAPPGTSEGKKDEWNPSIYTQSLLCVMMRKMYFTLRAEFPKEQKESPGILFSCSGNEAGPDRLEEKSVPPFFLEVDNRLAEEGACILEFAPTRSLTGVNRWLKHPLHGVWRTVKGNRYALILD